MLQTFILLLTIIIKSIIILLLFILPIINYMSMCFQAFSTNTTLILNRCIALNIHMFKIPESVFYHWLNRDIDIVDAVFISDFANDVCAEAHV